MDTDPAFKNPRSHTTPQTCPTTHFTPTPMKQSHILTPPTTPSSTSTSPHKPACERTKVHFDLHMSLHRSPSATDMSESSLWTLPGSSCLDTDPNTATENDNRWSRLLQKAASSNLDRHRARLESDGWAFVGGRYSDEMHDLADESAESVDDEFDLVVLASETVGC